MEVTVARNGKVKTLHETEPVKLNEKDVEAVRETEVENVNICEATRVSEVSAVEHKKSCDELVGNGNKKSAEKQ